MTVCLPATEVISIDAMASVDTVVWRCRLCDHHGAVTTRPTAHADGVEHLTHLAQGHHNRRRPLSPGRRRLSGAAPNAPPTSGQPVPTPRPRPGRIPRTSAPSETWGHAAGSNS